MKRLISILTAFIVVVSILSPACADIDDSRMYCFELLCDDSDECGGVIDDVIDVTLMLCRTDSDEAADMYALQDELHYDSNYLELVPDSFVLRDGVHAVHCPNENGDSLIKVDYIMMEETEEWGPETELMSFQMKIIDEGEISTLMNDNAFVTTEEGLNVFIATTSDLYVDCGEVMESVYSVIFIYMNGMENEEVLVTEGEKVERPETDPELEGFKFTGWYKDEEYKEPWDFENDVVEEDTVLYAGWQEDFSQELWLLIPLGVFLLLIVIIIILAVKLRKAKKAQKKQNENSLPVKELAPEPDKSENPSQNP